MRWRMFYVWRPNHIGLCYTSPIINLAAISQLNLLQQLYTRLVIPIAVYNEADLLPMDERRGRALARRNPKTADNSLKNRAPAVV